MSARTAALDDLLRRATTTDDPQARVPGVVAAVTRADGTLYEGAAGVRSVGDDAPMTVDTVFAGYSITKAVTGTAVMQCVEDGLLDLDAPAAEYLPELDELQVIEGFADDGSQVLRAPSTRITTRMLMLHTAGFGYAFFSEVYGRLLAETGQPDITGATKAALMTPLLFDPGTRWNYGTSMDWAGLVVEAVRGRRLGEVMAERIFAPLGMADTGFTMTPSMAERRATVHMRTPDGTLKPTRAVLPQDPEIQMGGHGLYTTMPDFTRFLRMWLRDGDGEHGRVLRPETVAAAAANGLGELKVGPLATSSPALARSTEFFPGLSKSWAYSFMVNDDSAPTGRSAGSLGWAGLANLYFWIDRSADVAGIWGSQILPFGDPGALSAYLDLETAVYLSLP
ncbi:beta-lactamase family protein [Gordonia alkaliphila]|uniref:serine hydrolase domain-containing protein n=1 Tax=Gordonia alkaliphila TaxID=1053547 RepID=UPI001FF20C79|nr:serine hydrolase domain-containing protein [Gordonia alkaliphila]MCK0439237.1 beta-lactamase family protein [Gordonia alkaliphila]